MDFLAANAARLVLLLVISPIIGAALAWLFARRDGRALLQQARVNATLTALIASLLALVDVSNGGTHLLQAVWARWAAPVAAQSLPWSVELVFSVGLDRWNAPLLIAIPWLMVAVLLTMRQEDADRPGFCISLFILEACCLLTFAAYDAVTFCLAAEAGLWCLWWLIGNFGGQQRRPVAESLFRRLHAGQLFWTLGLAALGIAAVWVQQEIRSDARTIRLDWHTLIEQLPRLTSLYVGSFQYWTSASGWLLTMLTIGSCLRAGLVPVHHAWLRAMRETPAAAALLTLGAGGATAGYGFARFVAPLLAGETWLATSVQSLAALTMLWCAMRALASLEMRIVVTNWWLSAGGLFWIGMASGVESVQLASWYGLVAVGLSAAGWLLVVQAVEQRFETSNLWKVGGIAPLLPRLTGAACVIAVTSFGLVPVTRAFSLEWTWLAVFTESGEWWWLTVAASLLLAWASLWNLQLLCFSHLVRPGKQPSADEKTTPADLVDFVFDAINNAGEIPAEPVDDLNGRELLAFAVIILVPFLPWCGALIRSLP